MQNPPKKLLTVTSDRSKSRKLAKEFIAAWQDQYPGETLSLLVNDRVEESIFLSSLDRKIKIKD